MSKNLTAINAALTIAMVFLCVIAVQTLGPVIEAKFFPVYSKFEVHRIERTEQGSRVVFAYTKLRQCHPVSFNWFIGEPGGAFRQVTVETSNVNFVSSRAIGKHISVPFYIDLAPEAITNHSYAQLSARCHPFWITHSVIYP